MIKKAIFIGDCYRPEQKDNINALFHIFSPLFKSFDIQASEFVTEHNTRSTTKSGLLFWQNSLLLKINSDLEKLNLEDSIVFAFEISKIDLDYLDSIGIPWLSFSIHPLRFLDDLYFEVQSSFLLDISDHYASPARIDMCAKGIYSRYIVKYPRDFKKSLCILGQTPFDKSVFVDGEFKNLLHYSTEIDSLVSEYDYVYYKPHPHLSCKKTDNNIRKRYNCLEIPVTNIYAFLISNPNASLCAISSSVLIEAPYFGNDSKALSSSNKKFFAPVDYRSLICDYDLWETIFKKKCQFNKDNFQGVIPQNFLRSFFNAWSFESELYQLQKDIISSVEGEFAKKHAVSHLTDELKISFQQIHLIRENTKETAKVSEDANNTSKEARGISEDANNTSKEARRISEDANITSKEASDNSNQSIMDSQKALKISFESDVRSKESLKLSQESSKFSQDTIAKVNQFEIDMNQINSKFVWFLFKNYKIFEDFILKFIKFNKK
jgi:hypothetical protein